MEEALYPGITLRRGIPQSPPRENEDKSPFRYDDIYETDSRISSGSFGTVYHCHTILPSMETEVKDVKDKEQSSSTSPSFAVKILDRSRLKSKDDKAVFREVSILHELVSHPHVITLVDFFVTRDHLYIVQELAAGGDVFARLCLRNHYSEEDARQLSVVLLETVSYIHERRIVHRDLKPENLLLRDESDDSSMLLADFGFARRIPEKEKCTTRCGTPAFVAPEVLLGIPYATSVDLWSVGCLLYFLISGYPCFQGNNHRDLFRKVRAGDFVFHEKYWKNVSVSAKQLIANLLTVNADKRWTALQALESKWIREESAQQLSSHDLSGSLREMDKFRPRRKWKSAAHAIGWAATAPFWVSEAVTFSQQLSKWDQKVFESEDKDDAATAGSSKKTSVSMPNFSNLRPLSSIMSKISRVRFSDVYELGAQLRKGSYATVWECVHKQSKEVLAVKRIVREGLQTSDDEAVLNEVALMQSLSGNKYVVQLLDFFEEEDCFYLVMEYMKGGDVFDRVVEKSHYTEKDARDLAIILLKAVRSLHQSHIAHRDIKPQNLLLTSKDSDSEIKLGDFGFSQRVHLPESLTSRVGTPTYVSPEVLKNLPHDERVDLWSVGVVIWVLLVGYPPFMNEKQTELFRMIRTGDYEFDDKDWKQISPDARQLVSGLLTVDPKERWTVDDALKSAWIRQDEHALSSISLRDSMEVIRGTRGRLRKLAKAFRFFGKDSSVKEVEANTVAQDTVNSIDQTSANVAAATEKDREKASKILEQLNSVITNN